VWKKHDHIVGIATANAHSMVLIEHGLNKAERRKDRDAHARSPDVYAWGYAASGRLGITIDGEEDVLDGLQLKLVSNANDKNSDIPKALRTYPPKRVQDEWQPDDTQEASKFQKMQHEDEDDETRDKNDWYFLQRKLFDERQDVKMEKLKDLQVEVDRKYRNFMKEVFKLWDKPEKGVQDPKVEYHLRKKEREIEIEYVRNLRVLDLGNSTNAPRLEGRLRTPKKIQSKMHYFEEMVWILQQQPMYLANLAKRLAKKRNDDDDAILFRTVVCQLCDEMKDNRTLCLFKALLRVLIKFEMDKESVFQNLFHPDTSRVMPLITHLATSAAFVERLALPIIDPDDPKSLIHNLIKYTISKDWNGPRDQSEKLAGILTFDQDTYKMKLDEHRKENPQDEKMDDKKVRQYFQNELKEMAAFFCVDDPTRDKQIRNIQCMDDFLKYFIDDKLSREECSDVQMILVFMARHLYGQRYVVQYKRSDDSRTGTEFYEPISAIILGGIIAGVLRAVESGVFAIYEKKILLTVEKLEGDMLTLANKQKKEGHLGKEAERDPLLQARVKWNIQALAQFFEGAVQKKADKNVERDTQEMATQLVSKTSQLLRNKLGHMLADSGDLHVDRKEGDFAMDITETQLTVSLYRTHLSLPLSRVWLKESHLLQLTNMLYIYMEPDVHDGDMQVRLDKASTDRLCQLVNMILHDPVKKKPELWNVEDILLSDTHGDYHNFTMRSRFLEHRREGQEHEPTFCEDSQVPIPRSLSKTEQKARSGVRAVKPYRALDRGPIMEIPNMAEPKQYPFEFLEELIQELSGCKETSKQVKYKIGGKTWGDLKASFEEMQSQLSDILEERQEQGHDKSSSSALLAKLSIASRMVERVHESQEEKELRDFIEKTIQKRIEYFRYLNDIKHGMKEIENAQREYHEGLKETYKSLDAVYKESKECEIPEDIEAMAQTHSAMPTLTKAKRRKVVYQKKHETPAQKVLNELSRNIGDGSINAEVIERVGSPACSFDLKTLTSKGVVVRVHDKIAASVQKKMVFNFKYEQEGYAVQVYMKPATMLKSFSISREDMQLMAAGWKTTVIPYGDDFVWLNCFRLRRLLGQIAADTEL